MVFKKVAPSLSWKAYKKRPLAAAFQMVSVKRLPA